jgi:hypothetical protein
MGNNYTVNYADPGSPQYPKPPITVPEQQSVIVSEGENGSSLTLVGRNYPGYAQSFNQNFLSLLENFASGTAPVLAVTGQLWYDSTNRVLKVNDPGFGWIPVNGVWSDDGNPNSLNLQTNIGDIYVDKITGIVYIFTGTWISLNSNSNTGAKSGPYPTEIFDKQGNTHNVIIMYLDDVALEIISKESFTPTQVIDGFTNLVPGINISKKAFNGITPLVNGVATVALSLKQINSNGTTQIVAGNYFMRNDTAQEGMNGQLIINNDGGIKIGVSTSTFLLQKSGAKAVIQNTLAGGSFNFLTYNNGIPNYILTLDGNANKVAIGKNLTNSQPETELNVFGSFKVTSGTVYINTSTNAIISPASANINGNVYVTGNLQLGGIPALTPIAGQSLLVNNQSTFISTATFSSGIQTSNTVTASQVIFNDIGSRTAPFNAVYAKIFGSSNLSSQFYGNFNGAAQTLSNKKTIGMSGVINSDSKIFDGNYNITLDTTVSPTIITSTTNYPGLSGTEITADPTDQILIYSGVQLSYGNGTGLFNITKQAFLADLYTSILVTGMIIPYGGTEAPPGWLFCDGTPQDRYGPVTSNLYSVIGTQYGARNENEFLLPNLNGPSNNGPYTLYTSSSTYLKSQGPVGVRYIIRL